MQQSEFNAACLRYLKKMSRTADAVEVISVNQAVSGGGGCPTCGDVGSVVIEIDFKDDKGSYRTYEYEGELSEFVCAVTND